MRKIIYIIFSFALFANAQNSLTSHELNIKDSSDFSFVVSGHFYGGSGKKSGYPAASILGNIDTFNQSDASFLMCLGDLFSDVKNEIPVYERTLFSKLKKPLLNAVGNHDLSGDVYQKHFGVTHYSYKIGCNVFVVLDTEENDGSIKSEQLELLKNALNSEVKNVFVFSHRPVWAEEDESLKSVFKHNTQSLISNNYQNEILPLLKRSKAKIFWLSGSLGGMAPASFFYHKKLENLTYVATAIRDLKRDAILNVMVKDEEVVFEPISLTGETLQSLDTFDVSYWGSNEGEKFNYRLIPLYIKQIVFHRAFWFGVLFTLLFVFIFKKIFRAKRS